MTGTGSGDPSDDPDRGNPSDDPDRGNPSDDRSTTPEGRQDSDSYAAVPDSNDSPDGSSTVDRGAPGGRGETAGGRTGPSGGNTDRGRPGERSASVGPSGPQGAGRSARAGDRVTVEDDGIVRWFLRTNDGTIVVVRDMLTSVAIVAVIGLLLFGLSGIWPPLVAVESESMEPNMYRGDLIFVVDENRFVGDGAIDGTGVVTYEDGADTGHTKFGNPGDVIIFAPDGNERATPVIHRAHYWVEEGDRWAEEDANPALLNGRTCDELESCPAPYDGFITMGDGNPGYDQAEAGATTNVVKPEWVEGKGMVRIPWLGHIRLTFDRVLFADPTATGFGVAPVFAGIVAAGGVLASVDSRRR